MGKINNEPSAGTLTIGLQPLSYVTPDVAVTGIHQIMLNKHGRRASVTTRDLPCGKAVIVIEQNPSLRIPAELNETGRDIPIDVAQLQAFIPVPQQAVPGAQEVLVLTFSTPSTDHWVEYCEVVTDVLRSLRFTPDEEASQEPATPTRLPKPPPATPSSAPWLCPRRERHAVLQPLARAEQVGITKLTEKEPSLM